MTAGGSRMVRIGRYVLVLLVCCAGCHNKRGTPAAEAIGYMGRAATLAVVPVQDLSGTDTLDSLALTDIFAHELAQVPQVSVVPVNQTVAVMLGQGWHGLSSPSQVQLLARMLNADGVVVIAVTMYDPYNPPRLGLIAEVYMVAPPQAAVLPGEDVNRLPAPLASQPATLSQSPVRQVQRVYDASQTAQQQAIRQFAKREPSGSRDWQEFLRNQRQFLRYCSWQVVMDLVGAARPPAGDDED
jgi:hypothetical protein